jgi:mycofactocin biosynthesis protein MftB
MTTATVPDPPPVTASGTTGLDLSAGHRLAAQVALRPEGFGALAYHFGNRRLTFLTSPALVRLVESLDGTRPLGDVLDERVTPRSRAAVEAALAGLVRAEVLDVNGVPT